MLLRRRNSAITFDVGGAGVRVGQVRAQRPQPIVTDALSIDLASSGAQTAPDPALPVERLVRLIGQGSFVGRDVALVLSQPEAFFHALRVPANLLVQGSQHLEAALAWEIARETRTDAADLSVRHWPLPPNHREGLNVMAVAIPTSRALEWARSFNEHHLHLRRIDVAPCGLARLALCDWQPDAQDAWGILDLGLRRTSVTVFVGQTPVYVRAAAVGSHQWTKKLAESFDVDYGEADQLKRQCGIRPAPRGARAVSGGDLLVSTEELPSVIFSVLRESLDTLVREANLCLSYVLESYPGSSAARLFLAGGGGELTGLDELLEAQLGLPTERLIPPATATSEESARRRLPTATAAAAIGGAMLDLEAA